MHSIGIENITRPARGGAVGRANADVIGQALQSAMAVLTAPFFIRPSMVLPLHSHVSTVTVCDPQAISSCS